MKKIQITFDCPDEETYLQVLGISKSFKEKLSGFAEVNIEEILSNPKELEAVHGNEAKKGVCKHKNVRRIFENHECCDCGQLMIL